MNKQNIKCKIPYPHDFPDTPCEKCNAPTYIESYTKQMAENHALKIDEKLLLVLKQKPKWMPDFIYKSVIKELIEFQQYIINN